MMLGKRPIVGEIFEFETKRGFVYLQVTHKDPVMGYLVRAIDGFFQQRPANIEEIASRGTSLIAFFPLAQAAKQRVVSHAGLGPIPESDARFPLFRVPGDVGRDGKVHSWFLWDGSKSWPVGDLLPQQRNLPIKALWNDTLLRERLEQGYRPEDDVQR